MNLTHQKPFKLSINLFDKNGVCLGQYHVGDLLFDIYSILECRYRHRNECKLNVITLL